MTLLIIFLFGLVFGSFLGAYTYRAPRNKSISKGRSYCPKCKASIVWYDNIPLFSYAILGGRCRNCGERISLRYPLIELGTALSFLIVFYASMNGALSVDWFAGGIVKVAGLFLITLLMIAIFVIDLENYIIPDKLSFLLLVLALLILPGNLLFAHLVVGFASALFFLGLYLITSGRGMGLGDVKLAIFLGTFFGFPLVLVNIFLAFVLGSIWGIILILGKRVKFSTRVPFAPFLVISFFLVLIFGEMFLARIFPYF